MSVYTYIFKRKKQNVSKCFSSVQVFEMYFSSIFLLVFGQITIVKKYLLEKFVFLKYRLLCYTGI